MNGVMEIKRIAIVCPKLNQGGEAYLNRITAMIDRGKIKSLTVMILEVPLGVDTL
jgi:hypothetical protein